mgnify:CR=1 FL=1
MLRAAVSALGLLVATPAFAQPLRVVSLPDGEPRAVDTDSAAEAAFVALSMPAMLARVPAEERAGLPERIAGAYARHHARSGPQPSIWAESVVGAPLVLRAGPEHAERAVIFLHGLGGSFTWPCGLVAEASARVGAMTFCPSLDADAHWARAPGRAVVRDTIALARRAGATRIVLAGLSSGGVGASRLAMRLGDGIEGLILLSGVDGALRASQRVLLVHGDRDRMVQAESARRFARRSTAADLRMLEGGHFVLAERSDAIVELIATWLTRLGA